MNETTGPKSRAAFSQALELFPGGVNSPVRAYRSVGGTPPVLARGRGAWVWDLDGRRYFDMVQSWGALILGHSPKSVVRAVNRRICLGASFGAPTEEENELARLIRSAMPSMEKMRFVNSGTEAVMSALRLARGYTGRSVIVKFDGGYHGHTDALLVKAGSGQAGTPDSAGVSEAQTSRTLSLPYNDESALRSAFASRGAEIAGVIIEPVPANMGIVPPAPGFLATLRELTKSNGALLIFDEVITGFRVGPGGGQELFGIEPDLTTLGKIIGGGLPVGAYGGRKDIMDWLAPLGPVYQAGTLSGNPAAMAAGTAVLREVLKPGFHDRLNDKAEEFYRQLKPNLDPERHRLQTAGPLSTLFFHRGPVENFQQALESDTAAFGRYFHRMLDQGYSLAPSQFEAGFIGAAHSARDLRNLARASARALQSE